MKTKSNKSKYSVMKMTSKNNEQDEIEQIDPSLEYEKKQEKETTECQQKK